MFERSDKRPVEASEFLNGSDIHTTAFQCPQFFLQFVTTLEGFDIIIGKISLGVNKEFRTLIFQIFPVHDKKNRWIVNLVQTTQLS